MMKMSRNSSPLGGKSRYNMIRGPMLTGSGHSSSAELKMNLGGPSG